MDSRLQTAFRLMAALGFVLAPAMTAQLALATSAYAEASSPTAYPQPAYAQPAPAGVLPPPAYAGSGQPVRYSGMQVYDRYGGETRHASNAVPSSAGSASTFTGAKLSWSGKVDTPATPARPAPYAYAQMRGPFTSTGYTAPQPQPQPQPQADAAPRGWTFAPPIGQPPAGQPVLPSSIYDRPQPVAQQPAQAVQAQTSQPQTVQAENQGETGPRHYSVHRDYGIEPDPIPLPPQFFGATADLSQPATDEPIRHPSTSGGKAQNPLQPADGQ